MANGYSAGSLFLGIEAEANNTLKVLDAVIDRLSIINKGLGNISKITKATEIATSSTKGKKRDKTFDNFLNVGKWTAVLYSAKRLGSYMGKVVQYGADYTETLNLWETAMGGNLTVATEFVNKMNEAYVISEKTLMNAQAIFKNMLGSLGQISDTMAYALSEGVTQMALDYASLYNVTFEQAFTKFQAALAGQVRPIRSVAGYDITENTLFQLYQSLGGEKTMRQLSRTEKQLLAIYAVFKQMDASGAVGDLDKTMERFANQSRVMAEGWQRTMTYAGVIATHLIEQSGLMVQLNAFLIFMADTLKAVAENMGAIKSFADPFESTTEGALDAGEAIDEVKGKLLGFDKFRSLSGGGNNVLGLDEKLLEALAGFDSILGNASMQAKELAEQFKIASGIFNEDGTFNPDRWTEITDNIKTVGAVILSVFAGAAAVGAITKFIGLVRNASSAVKTVQVAFGLLTEAKASGGTIASIAAGFTNVSGASVGLATALKMLTGPVGIVLAILGVLYATNEDFRGLVNDLIKTLFDLIKQILDPLIDVLGALFGLLGVLMTALSPIIDFAVEVLSYVLISVLATLELIVKVVSTLLILLESLFTWNWSGLGQKLNNLWGDWATTDFTGKVAAKYYAKGGLPDKGTMFVAGEAGAEMVYNMPSGQSGVANVRQIEQAMYNALARYGEQNGGTIVVQAYLDGEKVYENTTSRAKSRGNVWAKA